MRPFRTDVAGMYKCGSCQAILDLGNIEGTPSGISEFLHRLFEETEE